MHYVGRPKGIWAGHPPVRTQMWWPSQRAQNPDAGKGNRDGGTGESQGAFREQNGQSLGARHCEGLGGSRD